MTLKELAIKEYKERNIDVQPLYPAVLVRVLPKQLVSNTGLVHLTDAGENKTIYEGIVLRTWLPFTRQYKGKEFTFECPVKVGDHVLFPHWSGEHIAKLPDADNALKHSDYRMVPCRDYIGSVGNKDAGEILGILPETEAAVGVNNSLAKYLRALWGLGYVANTPNSLSGSDEERREINVQDAIKHLNNNFEIIRKIKTSVTRSGA